RFDFAGRQRRTCRFIKLIDVKLDGVAFDRFINPVADGITRHIEQASHLYLETLSPKEVRYSSSTCAISSSFNAENSFSCARLESFPPFWRRNPNRLLSVRSGISNMASMPARNWSKFFR